MRTRLVLAAVILAIAAGAFLARAWYDRRHAAPAPTAGHYQRIVSMSPSVTEILFALGLGDRVVGVTRYCKYPPEAQTRAKIGGHLDPNFEAIVALKPDLVITREDDEQAVQRLEQLGISTLVVNHKRLDDILDSLDTIGRACGVEARAGELRTQCQAKLDAIVQKTANQPRPRVLVVAERSLGTGRIEDVYVAGSYGYFDRLIALAGGENACKQMTGEFPVISAEGIIHLNPQVIVDLIPLRPDVTQDEASLRRDWQQLPEVEAVRDNRVCVLRDDYAFIPGPRLILLVEKLARLLHPELAWQP